MLIDFLNYLKKEVANGSIYVWGGQGQKATVELINKLETSESNKYAAKNLLFNRILKGYQDIKAFDCSGLVTKALDAAGIEKAGFDTTANGLFKNHCKKIKKADLLPGDLVFRVSLGKAYHVGVFIGNNEVIEAQGRAYGVVKRNINASGTNYWNDFGRYDKLKKEVEKQKKIIISRVLRLKSPMMKGEDVKELQKALINRGFSCGSCGADGEFGKRTDLAVRNFQISKKLVVDGQAGKNTITALGLIYKK